MNLIVIASSLTVIGAVAGIFLTHRLIGFRSEGPNVGVDLPRSASQAQPLDEASLLAAHIHELSVQLLQVQEELREREVVDEVRWRQFEETQKEVRQLRTATLRLRYDLNISKRLHDSDEARRPRERERERRRERELDLHKEREFEESARAGEEIETPLSTA